MTISKSLSFIKEIKRIGISVTLTSDQETCIKVIIKTGGEKKCGLHFEWPLHVPLTKNDCWTCTQNMVFVWSMSQKEPIVEKMVQARFNIMSFKEKRIKENHSTVLNLIRLACFVFPHYFIPLPLSPQHTQKKKKKLKWKFWKGAHVYSSVNCIQKIDQTKSGTNFRQHSNY